MLIVFLRCGDGVWFGPGSRRAKTFREPFSSCISTRAAARDASKFWLVSYSSEYPRAQHGEQGDISIRGAHGTTASLRIS